MNGWESGLALSCPFLSCPLVLFCPVFVCLYVGIDVGFEGGVFCGSGGVRVFLKNPLLNLNNVVIPFHMMLCI